MRWRRSCPPKTKGTATAAPSHWSGPTQHTTHSSAKHIIKPITIRLLCYHNNGESTTGSLVLSSPWGAVLAGGVQVLLHALIVVNLCGHWNGYGLSIVTTVTQRGFRRPAERERESEKGKGREWNSRTERTKERENTEHSEMHGADQ